MPAYTKAEALRWLAQLVACNGLDPATTLPSKGRTLYISTAYFGAWSVTAVVGGFDIVTLK